jgi:carboxyl-terminal processing protease
MQQPTRSRSFPAAVLVVIASAIAGGLLGGRVFATQQVDRIAVREQIYTAALAAIEHDYAEPVDSAQLVYGSVEGMLRTLDPHSYFFDPRQFAQMRERQEGRYYGLGIQIGAVDGDITVSNVFEGSPAYRSGIRRNDIIARIIGESAKGWTTDQAVAKLKGPKGTTVNISIRRMGVDGLIDLTVERDEVKMTTVRTAFMIEPGTGYIRLQEFTETSDKELSDALKKLSGLGMQRLALDLRDNGGGALDQAIAIASHFLKGGQMVVQTKGRVKGIDADSRALETGDYPALPMIVLVNRNSASASEIVSGALQDHDRALIVGETTFGKALVQSVYPISEGAGLALTTGHYWTPSGRVIQRPWDSSFDEYELYSLRDQNGHRDHPASELKYTDAGRKVYGGGGIEPDRFFVGPAEGFNPTYYSRLLVSRGMFAGFTQHFTAEGDNRPANRKVAGAHKVARGFEITPAMVDEFKQFVASFHMKIDEAAFASDATFIKAMIHYEVDNDLFDNEEARRNLSKIDPQALFALGLFDEAKKLLDLGKKGQ